MNESSTHADLTDFLYTAPSPAIEKPYLFRITRAGCSRCGQDFKIDRNADYPYFTVHFLLDGCGFFHIDGRDYLLKKGDAFIITPREAHLYRSSPDSSLLLMWIEFHGSFCRELFSFVRAGHNYVLTDNAGQKAVRQLREILHALSGTAAVSEYEISAMLYRMIMCLTEASFQTSNTQLPEIVAEALDIIENNYTQPLRISDLADMLHISHTYLTRLFRQTVGTTPLKYITMKKIEYACFLLRNTSLSCEKISEKTGFFDNAYFYKTFKALKGITPVQYRNFGENLD